MTVDSLAQQLVKITQQKLHSKSKQLLQTRGAHSDTANNISKLPAKPQQGCSRDVRRQIKRDVAATCQPRPYSCLFMVSSEKAVVDGLELSAVVDRFASSPTAGRRAGSSGNPREYPHKPSVSSNPRSIRGK